MIWKYHIYARMYCSRKWHIVAGTWVIRHQGWSHQGEEGGRRKMCWFPRMEETKSQHVKLDHGTCQGIHWAAADWICVVSQSPCFGPLQKRSPQVFQRQKFHKAKWNLFLQIFTLHHTGYFCVVQYYCPMQPKWLMLLRGLPWTLSILSSFLQQV